MTDDERATLEPRDTADEAAGASIETEADSTAALDVAAVLAAVRADSRDPVTGRFRPGGMPRLQHGRRAPRLWTAGPLAEVLAEREAGVVADLGGVENLSAVERPLAREYARLDLLVEAAGDRLIRDGLETAKGRARAAASLYGALLDRQTRLAGMLGLSRRARPAASLATWAATATSEAKS